MRRERGWCDSMRLLIKYEWKKIWGSRLNQLAVLGCGLFLLFCVYSVFVQVSATDDNGKRVSGTEAMKIVKETYAVPFPQEWADKLMKEFVDYTNRPDTSSDNEDLDYLSEEMYESYYLKNRDIFDFLRGNYGKYGVRQNLKEIFETNLGKDFYQARRENLEASTDYFVGRGLITEAQKEYWMDKDKQVTIDRFGPFESFAGWGCILQSAQWAVLIMLLVCVGTAPVFSGDYQTGEDSLLLTMRYGKSRLVRAKILTAFLHSSSLYWGITLVYSGIFLLVLGGKGGTLPIQLIDANIPISYALNMWQAVLLVHLLGYGAVLIMTAFTLLLSSLLPNNYSVIIVVFLTILIPTFLYKNMGGYLWQHILALIPAKIADFSFQDYLAYTIGGKVVTLPAIAIVLYLAGSVVFALISARVFQHHQVNR